MMDLGAGICSVKNPSCLICPIATGVVCAIVLATSKPIPSNLPKRQSLSEPATAYWIAKHDKVWLVRREGKGMLAGMRALT